MSKDGFEIKLGIILHSHLHFCRFGCLSNDSWPQSPIYISRKRRCRS